MPHVPLPLTQRNAQLVIAREYGFAGWSALTAEVSRRLGRGLEHAAAEARRAIHDNDVERLRSLLAARPELLTWRGDPADGEGGENGLLGIATSAFGDSFDAERERTFTRAACAELLLDAGAVVSPSVVEGLIGSRTRGLLRLFQERQLLPRTLRIFAVLGDVDSVREHAARESDVAVVSDAFTCTCRFGHHAAAAILFDRWMALDSGLASEGRAIGGRDALIAHLVAHGTDNLEHGPRRMMVMHAVMDAIDRDDLAAFVQGLEREPSLLGGGTVPFQARLIERATMRNRGAFMAALLDRDPAILRSRPRPQPRAIEFAFVYARTHLLPLLTRIWPLPDDLPHAAGVGDLDGVRQWFDASGAPALGDLARQFPAHDAHARGMLQWGAPAVQQVLDTALAYAVINRHFVVADFLIAHGANVNTDWGSHEPASILHELVGQVGTGENPANYESMRFLIERGIDMTLEDHRWRARAIGWARHAAKDEPLARWLEEAERDQNRGTPPGE